MNINGYIYIALLAVAIIPNLAQADQVNYEKATQLLVCASVYQLTESMLLVLATGKSSNAALSEMLNNKQKFFVTKAVQASSHSFVAKTRKHVIDRLIDKTMDEYAASIKNEKISYTDFLLMKFDKSCAALN